MKRRVRLSLGFVAGAIVLMVVGIVLERFSKCAVGTLYSRSAGYPAEPV